MITYLLIIISNYYYYFHLIHFQVGQIVAEFNNTLPKFKQFFASPHFNYLCDLFVNSFVSRGIIQNLYKCKKLSTNGATQLLLDVSVIKDALLHAVGMSPFLSLSPSFCILLYASLLSSFRSFSLSFSSLSFLLSLLLSFLIFRSLFHPLFFTSSYLLHFKIVPAPSRFVKLVNKEIGRVEAILKLLGMPNEAIVKGYSFSLSPFLSFSFSIFYWLSALSFFINV